MGQFGARMSVAVSFISSPGEAHELGGKLLETDCRLRARGDGAGKP